ncbi:MAG: energy-coupling factor ABC transporter ATP-binding protein [Bacilli bacterium]|nr:energy-coupling factor ABC transporter ATP-binding protein [Bacilli bacterium]
MEIKIKDVTYKESKNTILENINMTCKANKITVCIGKSGSGKTILLNLIDALKLPTKGEIIIDSFVIQKRSNRLFNTLRTHIGYVFSDPSAHFFCKTVYKELLFALASSGIKEEKEEKIERVLEMVELDSSIKKQSPLSLSFTEQKRVALAIALLKNPEIFLIDEPFLGLCSKAKKDFIKLFKQLKREYQKTIVITTKDTDSALELADYIYLLGDKKIQLEGTKYKVLKEEKTLYKYGVKIPDFIRFSNMVLENKGIKIGYRNDINDLIKDVYRYVK